MRKGWAAAVGRGGGVVAEADDEFDLHAGAAGQGGDLDGGAGRLVAAEALFVDGVQLAEVAEVGDEHGGLDHAAEAGPRLGQHGGQVVEHLLGLRLDPVGHAAVEGERDLPRGEQQVADPDGVAVGADGGRGAGGIDRGHAGSSSVVRDRFAAAAV